MKTKNRILALLLTVCMVMTMLPLGALAAELDLPAELPTVTEPDAPAVAPDPNPTEEPTELPAVPAEAPADPQGSATPGWDETGTTYTPTGIVNGGFESGAGEPWYSDVGGLERSNNAATYFGSNGSIAEGSWMVEVCGDANAKTVYQNIATVPGEVIRWSLQHHTRTTSSTADKIDVMFGPGGAAGTDAKPADGIKQGDTRTAGAPNTADWKTHTGDYVVPIDQTSTCFYFSTVSPATGGSGNLIDNVKFQTLLSAPYVSATTTDVKVRIYCTLETAPTMKFQAGVGHDDGTTFSAPKVENYLEGTIPFASLPGGTDKITVWAAGYEDFAQTVKVAPPTACYVSSTGNDGTGNGTATHPYATIGKAYAMAATGGEIRVLSNLTAATATTFGTDKTVTVTSYTDVATESVDGGYTITRDAGFKTTMLDITKGDVTLKHITLDGNNVASVTNPLVSVAAGAKLTLDTDATLQNNKHTGASVNGGGLVTAGAVAMNAGSAIKDNETTQFGGGVFVDGSGTFTMDGGTISGNKATVGDASGGGICINPTGAGIVTINGGTISGNSCGANGSAIHGGGASSKIILNGGSITGNISRAYASTAHPGGAVYPQNSPVTVGGGLIIKDNTATATSGSFKNTTSNLYLGKIQVATTILISNLTAGASIGVSGAKATAEACAVTDIKVTTATLADMKCFTSDDPALRPYLENGKEIRLRVPPVGTYVSSTGSDEHGNGTAAYPYSTLAMAYSQVKDADGIIYVMNDLAPTAPTDFATASKTVTITSCKANGTPWATASDTHTISRDVSGSLFTINQGTVTLKNITLTDKIHHANSPICIGNAEDANAPKLVMETGSTITGTESDFAAVYMFSGSMEMKDGSSITGNTNKSTTLGTGEGNVTPLTGAGGGVCVSASGKLSVAGNVKITGNTTANGATPSNVYLAADNGGKFFAVTGDLTADARIGVSGIDGVMDTAGAFGTTTETAAYVSNIMQDKAEPLMATHDSTTNTNLVWSAADTNWLDTVAAANYGWNDGNNNQVPDGITIDTPSKLYSLAYGIAHDYDPTNHVFDSEATGNMGASYANGFYDLTVNIDLSAFTWQPIGTTAIPFTGVFEGYPSAKTITGINHKAALTENGLFCVVAGPGARTYPGGGNSWVAPYTATLIQNIIVDGDGKTWTSGTATHMGGIAAKATDATIQNCTVQNLSLKILNTPSASVFVGGIVGETTTCTLLNNTVVHIGTPAGPGAAMTLTADAGSGNLNSHTGGIVGKATSTAISGNTVSGNDAHYVEIIADPSDNGTAANYAGGVVGYMADGSIDNETWAHLNAMAVIATSTVATNEAYAGGVAGFLAGDATMTNCTPGANNGEKHIIAARRYSDGFPGGKNYAGGLVGGMSGTSSITNSTIGASGTASYTVNAGVGAESVAGGLVGTMATGTSLTDCTISGDNIDSVKVTAAGTAGGLVGTAMDARVFKCNAESVAVTGNLSGGIAGQFTATTLATDTANAPGVMALCYARNCELTGVGTTPRYCSLVENADKATLLGCYATMPQHSNGIYGFKSAAGAKLVGCYSAGGTADRLVFDHNAENYATYENCYYITATGTADAADADTVVGLTAKKMASSVTLPQVMSGALQTGYNNMTDSLRMSYMPGNAPEIFGNYNYPMYAAWMLTVNTAPGSVYGSYTVIADGRTISAPGATSLNQYWVGKGADIVVTGTADGTYATLAPTISNNSGVINDIAQDETVTVTFTPVKLPGWTINGDLSGVTTAPYTDVTNGDLSVTANKLTGNTVKSWITNAGEITTWTVNNRTIKTIFVTASTANGYNNPTIKEFTAAGWKRVTGGVGKSFVQLTSEVGATADQVAEVINSFAFAAEKPEGGDVTVNVQVYVDENIRGAMYFNGSSVYELAGSPASYASAKLLAETSTFGAKQGHLVVIGDSTEHSFLTTNVVANAWTAAKSTGDNTVLTNWTWDVAGTPDASYLKNQSSWASGEPNKSGTYATYNYGGKLDDTNGANLALIEYDSLSGAATGWQADSALSTGSITLSFEYPYIPRPTPPKKPEVPGEIVPTDPHKNGVAKLLEVDKHVAYLVGNDAGNFAPEADITRAEVAQIFYNLLKDKGDAVGKIAYSDVAADAWYAKAVNALSNLGIMKGVGDGLFAPERNISRAEFTAIAFRFADDIAGTVTFKDVPPEHWAYKAISGAAQYGWIMGYADGTFKPQGKLQRAETAKIVNTMLGRFSDKAFIDKSESLQTFPDVKSDHWAFYDIVEATNAHEFTKVKNVEKWSK